MHKASACLLLLMASGMVGVSISSADTLAPARSAYAFTSNDSLHWGSLGVNNYFVPQESTLSSVSGILTTVNFGHTGPNVTGATLEQCGPRVPNCTWSGNFAPGDELLTDLNFNNSNDSGWIKLSFATGVSGVGFQLEPNAAPGPGGTLTFSTEIAVYDGSTLLDIFYFPFGSEQSHGMMNTAGFYGVTDLTGADITSIEVLAYNCGGVGLHLCGGFAMNQVRIEDAPTAQAAAATPEPTSLALLGSGVGMLGFLRRKLAARK